MKIHLIRGFTTHGKSTFAKKLSIELGHLKIYSFADSLKQEVKTKLNVGTDVGTDVNKDEILPIHLQDEGCTTIRDWCKKIALEKKSQDKFYFAKRVHEQILKDFAIDAEIEVIIDDFRFPEELEYFKDKAIIQHYLVFHNEGAIPDPQNTSEHSLSSLSFDNEILVIR